MANTRVKKFMKPEEAAERLSVSAKSIRQWLREGKLKGVRAGKLWRITDEALDIFVNGQIAVEDGGRGGPAEPGDRDWLEPDLSRLGEFEPYQWEPGELEGGVAVRHVEGLGLVVEDGPDDR